MCVRGAGTRVNGALGSARAWARGSCATATSRWLHYILLPYPCARTAPCCFQYISCRREALQVCAGVDALKGCLYAAYVYMRAIIQSNNILRHSCVRHMFQSGRWRKGGLEKRLEPPECALAISSAERAAAAARRSAHAIKNTCASQLDNCCKMLRHLQCLHVTPISPVQSIRRAGSRSCKPIGLVQGNGPKECELSTERCAHAG